MDFPNNLNQYLEQQLIALDERTKKFLQVDGLSAPEPTEEQKQSIIRAYFFVSTPWVNITSLLNKLFSSFGASVDTSQTRTRNQNDPIFVGAGSSNSQPYTLNTTPLNISEQLNFLNVVVGQIPWFKNKRVGGQVLLNAFQSEGSIYAVLPSIYNALCFVGEQTENPCTSQNPLNVCWVLGLIPNQQAYISNTILACYLSTKRISDIYKLIMFADFETLAQKHIEDQAGENTRDIASGTAQLHDRETIKDELTFEFKEVSSEDGSDANSLGYAGLNNLIPNLGGNKNLGGYLVALVLFSDYFVKNEYGSPMYVKYRQRFAQYALDLLSRYNEVMFDFISSVDKETLAKRKAQFEEQFRNSEIKPSLSDYVIERLKRAEDIVDDKLKSYGSGAAAGGLALLNPALIIPAGSLLYTAQMQDQVEEITEQAKQLCEKMEILMLLNKQSARGLSLTTPFAKFSPPIEPLFAPVSNFTEALDRTQEVCFAKTDEFWCKVYTYTASAAILGLAFWGLKRLVKSNV